MNYVRKIKIIVYGHKGGYCVARFDENTSHKGLPIVFCVIGEVSLRKGRLLGQVLDGSGKVLRDVCIKNHPSREGLWDMVVCDEASRRGITHLTNMRRAVMRLTQTA